MDPKKSDLHRLLFTFFLALNSVVPYAQDSLQVINDSNAITRPPDSITAPVSYKLNKAYLLSYFTDLGHVVTRPLHWKGRDWRRFSVFSAVTAGALSADWEIRRITQLNHSQFATETAKIVEPFGNRYGVFLFPAMYVAGLATNSDRIQSVALGGTKSLAISTLIYATTKTLIRRNRPDRAGSSFDFAPPFQRKSFTSSPSGHSNTIFTVATALALEFKDTKWVPIVAYSIATLTSISRVYENRHWASDVIVGAALGHFITKAVWNNNNRKTAVRQVW